MIYTQSDIKAQIKAAKADKSGTTTFSTEVTERGELIKKFVCKAYTNKDAKNDIYPHILVRYENQEHFKLLSYSFQQLKMLAEDLTNFIREDEYIHELMKR